MLPSVTRRRSGWKGRTTTSGHPEPNSPANGDGVTWTPIAERAWQSAVLPTTRHTWGDFVAVNSPTNYSVVPVDFPNNPE